VRRNAAQLGRTRHGSTVVAGRMRCNAALRSFIIKCKNRIGCASGLEGADLLKIFALKKQRRIARVIQPRIRQDGRAMNVWANPLVRCADRIQIEFSN
jgi:hypothetical protein